MAVDLVGLPRMEEQVAIQEAASAGLKSMEHLIRVLSSQPPSNSHRHNQYLNNLDCRDITDFTVSKFKQVINLLNRTGHARFRRGPSSSNPSSSVKSQSEKSNPTQTQVQYQFKVQSQSSQGLTLDFAKPNLVKSNPKPSTELSANQYAKDTLSISPPMSTTTSSFLSSITADGSVSDGKIGPLITAPVPTVSTGKPPLSSSHKKRCHDAISGGVSGKISSSGHCHCSKRRYLTLYQAASYRIINNFTNF